ncbi:DUF4062 domain-containing protein [Bradyrhizobium sp. WSM 1738]|uniref:DUF4062 domain-containing protein n=1 Tax=Bradyrhizobium hereditatis TaxID=2821405 RepID=UPI001CE38A03|nr:DUF4062 domain-containing protein [Bradyrhizobium hereditatis]MCA6113595.1 DUF4062 domain-containing protein [Bradyrhizobium hereditatis]
MHSQLQALNVFLASPGDLAEERRIARSVIDELNSSIGRPLGWRIELYGWEDTPIGAVRPQSQINEEVNQCDLFVGLLWERWGHPPGESEYQSGFEEELALARARWARDGQPEIWLFLKDIDPKLERDPGDQTKLVLAFRQRIREEQKLFYKQFGSTDEWTQEFRKRLSHYLVTLAAPKTEHSNPSSSPARAEDQAPRNNVSLESGSKSIGPSSQQAIDSVEGIADAIKEGALGKFEPRTLDEPALARLMLLTSTFQAAQMRDELLGAHQANLIFRFRSEIRPTKSEWLHLTKSMIADQTQTIPGWAWTRPYAGFKDILVHIAATDDTEAVATGALRIVRELKLVPKASDRRNLFTSLLRSKHEGTLIEGLRWLEVLGSSSDRWFAEEAKAIASNEVRLAAEDALLSVQARLDPAQACDALLASDHKHSDTVITKLIGKLDTTRVQLVLSHPLATVRKIAAIELNRRKVITKQVAGLLLADADVAVQRLGIEAAIALGESPSFEKIRSVVKPTGLAAAVGGSASREADGLIVEALKWLPESELRKKIDWFGPEGRLAYSALAQKYFQSFASQLRADIADNFASLQRKSSDAAIERLGGGEFGRNQVETYEREGLNDFIRGEYLRAAVGAIAKYGTASDRPLIEPLIRNADYTLAPLVGEFLGKNGVSSDATTVISLYEKSWGNANGLLSLAVKLSSEPHRLALDSSLSKPTRAKIIQLLDDDQILALRNEWLELLNEDSADIRKGMVLKIFAVTRTSERKKLLDQLHGRATYYYDTIYWLDRLSYTAKNWQISFADSLSKHLTNSYRKDWLRE